MSIAPEEAEGVASNHLASVKLCLARAQRRICVKPTGEASLATTVGAWAEPSQGNRLKHAEMTIAPIELQALLFAEYAHCDGGLMRCLFHGLILRFARKR